MTFYDTTIAGGGVPGMALAVLLARRGLRVLLADAQPPCPPLSAIRPSGRTAALMGGAMDVLAKAGAWPLPDGHGAPLRRMAVCDDSRFPAGQDAMVEQIFDAAELGRDAFGWNLPLDAMRAALADRIKKEKGITHLTGTSLASFIVTPKCAHVTLSDGSRHDTALLVGCDGRDSRVRENAGLGVQRRAYGQHAITCLVTHTRPHGETSVEFHRPGGPFTMVPMPGDMSSIVWVEKDADAHAFLKLPRPAFTQALQDRTRDRLGKIALASPPAAWPLEYLRADAITAPRIALAAEAAHVISPIGAQGLNLSLRDVAALAKTIADAHGVGLDIGSGSVLARYAAARKGDIVSRTFTIDLANQAVANDSRALRALRRLTLRALSLPGPWRHLVMKKGLAA